MPKNIHEINGMLIKTLLLHPLKWNQIKALAENQTQRFVQDHVRKNKGINQNYYQTLKSKKFFQMVHFLSVRNLTEWFMKLM